MGRGVATSLSWVVVLLAGFLLVSSQNPEEELVYQLPGFSVQSGIRVGEVFDPIPPPAPPPPPPAAENATEEEIAAREAEITRIAIEYQKTLDEHAQGPPVIHTPAVRGNESEFTICLRFKPHYQRPEYILFSSYSVNKTAVVIGVDEGSKEIYLRYSKSEDSAELTRVTFNFLPRLDVWEHVCFVKGPAEKSGEEYKKVDFYYNGKHKGDESDFTANLDDLTLVVLGQSDPPFQATAFSGEMAHFAIWPSALSAEQIKTLALCGEQYYNLLGQAIPATVWQEGIWHQMVHESNTTEVDPLGLPTGMMYDYREVCRQVDKKDKAYLLPIYRKKNKDFHAEMCEYLGGEVPDLVNFGKEGSDKRIEFAEDIFLSARIPNVLDPTKAPVDEDEAPKGVTDLLEQALLEESKQGHVTPLNMMECFVNDEFVVWIDESKEASKPPNARGAKGLPKPPGAPPSGPIDPNTGKPLFSILGKLGVAFGPGIGGAGKDAGANKECPYHVMSNGTIVKKCDNDPIACSVCLISRRRPPLRARGLCEKSWLQSHRKDGDEGTGQEEFDTAFYPKADKLTGETVFRGPLGSHIYKKYNTEDSTEVVDRNGDWVLESLVRPWRDASQAIVRKIPATKLPLGRHDWDMVTEICDAETASVALTSCKKDKFTCKSGKCIPLTYRCDIYEDCDDGEDEEGCAALELGDDYSEAIAPRHTQKGIPWPVYIGVEVVSFSQIAAIEQKIAVDFYLTLRWQDPRLEFKNLRDGKFDNPIPPETTQGLWVPRLGLLNGLSEFQTIVTEDEAEFYRGYVWKRTKPKKSGLDEAIENSVYDGSKNPIILLREFYQEFTCHFNLQWYPFDKQHCYMNFTVQGNTAKSLILRPDNKHVNYLGEEYLVEYQVLDIELIVPRVASGNFSTATVKMTFQRRVVYFLLNVFLQSFFLVLTGYMSLFFAVNNFSDRVMVALTVMLVMASLQSSVQDSLPKTAYFKFIDWWILIALNTQIWIMAFHTFQGIYAAKEYLRYKEAMAAKAPSSSEGNHKVLGNSLSVGLEPMGAGSKNSIMQTSASESQMFPEEEILSPEEFDYPKTARLNKIFNLIFLILLTGFNVVYWSVAMGVYFS